MARLVQQLVIEGLNSAQTSVQDAGKYALTCKISNPTVSKGDSANSAAVALVKQNGSTIFTSPAGAEGFNLTLTCAANDVIQVSLSSAAAVDQPLNVIKTSVAIG